MCQHGSYACCGFAVASSVYVAGEDDYYSRPVSSSISNRTRPAPAVQRLSVKKTDVLLRHKIFSLRNKTIREVQKIHHPYICRE